MTLKRILVGVAALTAAAAAATYIAARKGHSDMDYRPGSVSYPSGRDHAPGGPAA